MIFNNYSSPENLLTSRCVCEFGVYHRLQANHLKAMRPSGKTSRLVAFKCVSSLLEHVLKKGNDDENKACFRVVPGMMTKAKVGRCLHKLIYTSTSQSILRYFSLAELVFREICRLSQISKPRRSKRKMPVFPRLRASKLETRVYL